MYGAASPPTTVSARELVRGLRQAELIVLAVEAALLALYVWRLRRGKPAGLLSAKMWLTGGWRVGFWGGIVGLALSLPFVLVLVNLGLDSEHVAVVAALSVLTGGFLLRCGVLAIGVIETPPLVQVRALARASTCPGSGRAARARRGEPNERQGHHRRPAAVRRLRALRRRLLDRPHGSSSLRSARTSRSGAPRTASDAPLTCHHCETPSCAQACPTKACRLDVRGRAG